jgi:hypothetical protein
MSEKVLMKGAGLSTAWSGADELYLHGVAQIKGFQDDLKREGFSLSSAPGLGHSKKRRKK